MRQTKYASAVPKNLGLGFDFWLAVRAITSPGVLSPWVCLSILAIKFTGQIYVQELLTMKNTQKFDR
jgi:hypothetical protein